MTPGLKLSQLLRPYLQATCDVSGDLMINLIVKTAWALHLQITELCFGKKKKKHENLTKRRRQKEQSELMNSSGREETE